MAERSTKKIYFSVLVTLLLLIFLHYLGWFSWLEIKTRQGMSYFIAQVHLFGINKNKQAELTPETIQCQNEYDQIIYWQKQNEISIAQLKIVEQENSELKKILNFSKNNPNYKILTATTIGKSSENTERIISISVGTDQGVKNGQAVVVMDGIMVGKIIRVERNVAWVRLINDSSSKIAATIINEEKSQGVVEGGYGLSVNMNFIPRNEKVSVGETVITSGLDQNVPQGLLLGTVAAVVNEAYQPFQKAVLNPAVDLSKVSTVGILIGDNI